MLIYLEEAIKTKYGSQKAAAEAMGIDDGNLSKLINETTEPHKLRKPTLHRIHSAFPEYNLAWLIYGTGLRFHNQERAPNQLWPEPPENTPFSTNFNKPKKEGIPMYEVEISASAVGMYNDFAEQKPIGYLQIPGFEDCTFAVPVWGHSMYPTFENGTWIVCKEIQNKESIVPGECYYIEWDDYRMVKRIIVGDNDDEIMLYSDNDQEIVKGKPKYAAFNIKKKDIKKLYLVKGVHKKLTH